MTSAGLPRSPSHTTPFRDHTNLEATRPLLWRLYLSHALSTWNARTFEFGAVIFLASVFPRTLFFTSIYALFRSAAAAFLGPWIGNQVDRKDRLHVVRQSIVWQRLSVTASCVILAFMLRSQINTTYTSYSLFSTSVLFACFEKVAFAANTVAIERDWAVVVSDSLGVDRQELNSVMRRIDLVCKLIAPVIIGIIDSVSTKVAIWLVLAQNVISVAVEYFAIEQVYIAVPELARAKTVATSDISENEMVRREGEDVAMDRSSSSIMNGILKDVSGDVNSVVQSWKNYFNNPAFLASFSLSLLYLTVLGFASQMTTYLLSLGFTSTHVSLMRLVSVILELSATCVAPWLITRIGAVRSGLWFINEQLMAVALAVGLFSAVDGKKMLAGGALVIGVCLSRLGLWGFDLSVQYLVQENTPEATRGLFSAIEMSLQNFFELLSFATTMIFYRPEDFKIPIYLSAGAIATSAACFAGFVRQQRGHLLHTDKCLKRGGKQKVKYQVLPTIEEEVETDNLPNDR